MEQTEQTPDNFEFVKKFSYRDYEGPRTSRMSRIFSIATFEVVNTWKKSTLGKIILGFVVFLNVFQILILTQVANITVTDKHEYAIQAVFKTAVDYLSINSVNPILPSDNTVVSFSFNIGFLIIALLAIAGSGFFADDRQGKVVEIYLSRMKRGDYALGKVIGMFLYCSVFITVPFLVISIYQVQSLGQNQFDFLGIYLSLLISGSIISGIFTIFTLILSSLVEKRAYASLSFFIGYILIDSLSQSFYLSDPSNQMLLLLVPSYVISLLIYTVGGHFNLGYRPGGVFGGGPIEPLVLNDGIGLEWFHVIGVVLIVFIIGLLFLLYKIHRITTNEI